MTITEYLTKVRRQLDNLEKYWLTQSKGDSRIYPKELSEEEWFEQEVAYRGIHISD